MDIYVGIVRSDLRAETRMERSGHPLSGGLKSVPPPPPPRDISASCRNIIKHRDTFVHAPALERKEKPRTSTTPSTNPHPSTANPWHTGRPGAPTTLEKRLSITVAAVAGLIVTVFTAGARKERRPTPWARISVTFNSIVKERNLTTWFHQSLTQLQGSPSERFSPQWTLLPSTYDSEEQGGPRRMTTGEYGGIATVINGSATAPRSLADGKLAGQPKSGMRPATGFIRVDSTDTSRKGSAGSAKSLGEFPALKCGARWRVPGAPTHHSISPSERANSRNQPSVLLLWSDQRRTGYIPILSSFTTSRRPRSEPSSTVSRRIPKLKNVVLDLRGNGRSP